MIPEAESIHEAISKASTVRVASHMNPDGDAIGAILALCHGLEVLGKSVRCFSHDPVPMNLRFLPGWHKVEHLAVDPVINSKCDLAFVVDVNQTGRIGRPATLITSAEKVVIIDHHQPGEETIGDIRVIDTDASATCLILYRLLPQIGIKIDRDIAQNLLTGIATDTGSFRFQNTDPASLDAASHLVELGADLSLINEEVWGKKPLAAVLLLRAALNHMELVCDGRISVSHLSNEDYVLAHATDEHSEGIVNEVGRVDTVLISAIFREPRPGRIRVSVRSRGEIDVSAVCRQFGGGGHRNAAGCTFDNGLEDAKSKLIPALIECLDSYS